MFSPETPPTTASPERAAGASAEAAALDGDAEPSDILIKYCYCKCDVVAVKGRGSFSVDALRVIAVQMTRKLSSIQFANGPRQYIESRLMESGGVG